MGSDLMKIMKIYGFENFGYLLKLTIKYNFFSSYLKACKLISRAKATTFNFRHFSAFKALTKAVSL